MGKDAEHGHTASILTDSPKAQDTGVTVAAQSHTSAQTEHQLRIPFHLSYLHVTCLVTDYTLRDPRLSTALKASGRPAGLTGTETLNKH